MNPPTPVTPVTVTVIGNEDRRATDTPLTSGTVATTPDHLPDVIVNVVQPAVAIGVRFAFMFVKSLLGFMTIAMIPPGTNPVMLAMHGMDFQHLLWSSMGLAIAPTVYDLIQSLVTVLGRLESKYPLATGSI